MVGGSGLYTKAVLEGLDDMPPANDALRKELQHLFDSKGILSLQERLKSVAPEKFAVIDIQNTQRVMRAIEIAEQERTAVLKHKVKKERDFNTIKIGLTLPRDILYDRINKRVDIMIRSGLEKEAKALYPQRQLNALQTVGYNELFDYFDNKYTLEKAIELIKQHTRNFAKRQLTWFKKEQDIKWFSPDDPSSIIAYIQHNISQSGL
jgi:tRNA dimethylallyltransferase